MFNMVHEYFLNGLFWGLKTGSLELQNTRRSQLTYAIEGRLVMSLIEVRCQAPEATHNKSEADPQIPQVVTRLVVRIGTRLPSIDITTAVLSEPLKAIP